MSKKLSIEEKELRKLERSHQKAITKEEERIKKEKNQKPVKEMIIAVEWKRSRVWGFNPHASAHIQYYDGSFSQSKTFKASGCGYDKESTVIAMIFDENMKYKLWEYAAPGYCDLSKIPYGIHTYENELIQDQNGTVHHNCPYYMDGVGISCYYKIANFIGGEFNLIASGRHFDVYKYSE